MNTVDILNPCNYETFKFVLPLEIPDHSGILREVEKPRLLFFLILLINRGAFAAPTHIPPKTFQEIIGTFHPSQFLLKPALRVTTARVLEVDYELIRRDFEITRTMSTAQIDEWLLESAACISRDQVDVGEKRGVNTAISIDLHDPKSSLRPPNYGRALVIEVEGGILDAKGAGGLTQAISQNSHRNGLMETAEAIREFAFTKLVRRTLAHAGSEFSVIDGYAVIDFGFQVKSPVDATFQPAGLLLRQSHFRDIRRSEQLEQRNAVHIEQTLREYGITSAYKKTSIGNDKTILYDVLNVQGSDAGKFIFDFGGYRISDHFQNQAITLSDLFEKKLIPILTPKSTALQPDPRYSSLFQAWGGEGAEERIWLKAREIAGRFRTEANVAKARGEISALLQVTRLIPEPKDGGKGTGCLTSLKPPRISR